MGKFSNTQPKTEPVDNQAGSQTRRYQGKAQKKGWYHAVSRAIAIAFRVLRHIVELIAELIEHFLALIAKIFEVAAQFFKSPYVHYIASILIFIGLILFALHQWFLIGDWFGKLLRSRGVAGLIGLGIGVALNLFQLSPSLWKLDFRVAQVYSKSGINPHFEPEEEESPSQRANNWSSHGHRSLKTRSIVCYIVEWTLYLIYWVVALKLSLLGLVSGFIALVLPQWALAFALQTQEIMRKILQSLDEDEASIPSAVNL